MAKATKRDRQKEQRIAQKQQAAKKAKLWVWGRYLIYFILLCIATIIVGVLLRDNSPKRDYDAGPPMMIEKNKTYTATVQTSRGNFEIELNAKEAPVSVNNFVFLARNRYYDGLSLDAITGSYIVFGQKLPKAGKAEEELAATAGPYTVLGEVSAEPPAKNQVAFWHPMGEPAETIGAAFLVYSADEIPPEEAFPVFGKVTKGADVIEEISKIRTIGDAEPTKAVTITKVEVFENGKKLEGVPRSKGEAFSVSTTTTTTPAPAPESAG